MSDGVVRFDLTVSPGTAEQEFIRRSQGAPLLAVDDQYIYWAATGGHFIGRARLDGTLVENEFVDLEGEGVQIGGIAVDGSHIYWTDWIGKRIGRANRFGTGIETGFIPNAGVPRGIAVNGEHVFWSTTDAGAGIARAGLDGSDPDLTFITEDIGRGFPYGLAVDFEHVYWANYYFCDFQTTPYSFPSPSVAPRATQPCGWQSDWPSP